MEPKCLLTSTDLQTRRARCQHQLSFLFLKYDPLLDSHNHILIQLFSGIV